MEVKQRAELESEQPANANGVERTVQKGTAKPDLSEKTKDLGASKRNVGNSPTKPMDRTDVPGSKGKANTSADSGYASAKGNHPNVSEENFESRQSTTREASSMKAGGQQGTPSFPKKKSGLGRQLAPAKKPIEAIPIAQPEETGVIEENISDAAENELATGPVDDDDYVHELFGSYEEEEEEEEEDHDGYSRFYYFALPSSIIS